MTTKSFLLLISTVALLLSGCSGGGSGTEVLQAESSASGSVPDDAESTVSEQDELEVDPDRSDEPVPSPVFDEEARYQVTLESFWGVESFPQGFPDDAHLSVIGGATHNDAVTLWEPGELASRGIEDMAEAGMIDILLFDEVVPAIENGTADSLIEVREYTDPQTDGVPGIRIFEISMDKDWPRVSLVSMLGPSPDWFVGVSGLSLREDDRWMSRLEVDLPLYDGGTKSDIVPVMGGPDIIPADPIGLVAYDTPTGVYLPTQTPHNVARLTFELLPAAGR